MTTEVTPEDREAAWVLVPYPFIIAMKITKEGWLSGCYDHNRYIQAFARRRRSAYEKGYRAAHMEMLIKDSGDLI